MSAVREFIQHVRIEGCGGATGGLDALQMAARGERVIMIDRAKDAGVSTRDRFCLSPQSVASRYRSSFCCSRRTILAVEELPT